MKEKERPLAAHIRTNDGGSITAVQTLEEHSQNVAELASAFASTFGGEQMAFVCGLFHDLGKAAAGFQNRIWENGPKVDHSTYGALEILCRESNMKADRLDAKVIFEMMQKAPVAHIAAYCITGHHAGLMNGGDLTCERGTLSGRFFRYRKDSLSDPGFVFKKMLPPKLKFSQHVAGFTLSFYTRMLFSCLVDADYLDTEAFMKQDRVQRGGYESLAVLSEKLGHFLNINGFLCGEDGINLSRSKILKESLASANNSEQGLYTMTVPTRGGKTVSSLAFALNHAVKNSMDRVIYVIPYCSIIDQTVEVFERIVGKENVLAHYSEASYEDDEKEDMSRKRLASENWDAPLIVTTAVQFFESLYSNKPSKCRKLHNIANSVIVFDEAQTIPISHMKPCISAVAELVINYHSTCVLCTATQPSVQELFLGHHNYLIIEEICPTAMNDREIFVRAGFVKEGVLEDRELAERLGREDQVLCIVSTRKQAMTLYEMLEEEGCYHLSTLLMPRHRRRILQEIRRRLERGEPCRVIATSLVEAGVDLDFPIVYRAYAGLDNEIQAAGRCNREGKRDPEQCKVYLFEPESKYKASSNMRRPKEVAFIVTENIEEIDDPKVIKHYYEELYDLNGAELLDKQDIVKRLCNGMENNRRSFPFADVSAEFHLIDDITWKVIIPVDDRSRRICEQLQENRDWVTREDYRVIGEYTVNVYQNQFSELEKSIVMVGEREGILIIPALYNEKRGLSFKDDGGEGIFV